jgi:NAD(P)-dependent dehydrogenase (short-subunit alcohol dehydrogenase family)
MGADFLPSSQSSRRLTGMKLQDQVAVVTGAARGIGVGDTIEWINKDFVAHTRDGAKWRLGRDDAAEKDRHPDFEEGLGENDGRRTSRRYGGSKLAIQRREFRRPFCAAQIVVDQPTQQLPAGNMRGLTGPRHG